MNPISTSGDLPKEQQPVGQVMSVSSAMPHRPVSLPNPHQRTSLLGSGHSVTPAVSSGQMHSTYRNDQPSPIYGTPAAASTSSAIQVRAAPISTGSSTSPSNSSVYVASQTMACTPAVGSMAGAPRPGSRAFNHEDFVEKDSGLKARELKVEDALLYLDQVKQQFGKHPSIYNQFLDVMKNFKSQNIDTPGVINRVSTLFKGYPRLILGFNTFLPPGFKIRADSTYEVAGQHGEAGSSFPINTNVPVSAGPGSGPGWPKVGQASETPAATQKPPAVKTPAPAKPQSAAVKALPRRGQPVEFDHAITYVTTIKKRFLQEPETYKAFLEILHTYQKEQRSIKQVLEQVSHLFRDHPDLLREFTYFLPDAAQEEAKATLNHEAELSMERKRASLMKKKSDKSKEKQLKERALKDIERFRGMKSSKDRQKMKYQDKRNKKRSYDEKERRDRYAYEESNVLPAEWHFFERARKVLPTRDSWREFLKCLDLYSQEVLGQEELLSLISNLFGRHVDIVQDFKTLLDQHGARDTHNDVWFSMPLAEIDFSRCRRCTPSYRALPASYPNPACSIRSDLEKDVCNDAWVSVPTGSEDFSFKNMRKNQYEEALFKCEDERFEIDMLIDANVCTIRILEPLAKEIAMLKDKENSDMPWDYRIDRRTFGVIHLNAIARVYGENGNDILELLRKHPAGTIPVVLERLKQKDAEWQRARQDLNKQWKEVNEKNFHKSLDHCSFYFKQQDKKQISTKGLLAEAAEKLEKDQPNETEDEKKEAPIESKEKNGIWTPHFTFDFSQPFIHRITYAVMAYTVEHNCNDGEKEKLAKLWKDHILHFLNLPEDWLLTKPAMRPAPATNEEALAPGTEVKTGFGEGTVETFRRGAYTVSLTYGRAFLQPGVVEVEEKDRYPPNACVSDDVKYLESEKEDQLSSEHVRLMYDGQAAYAFFRLYYLLYHRLLEAHRLCEKAKRNRRKVSYNPAARALAHKHHTEAEDKEEAGDFEAYLSTLYSLLDGTIDNSRYEDVCRNLMGSSSFVLSTMDKLVSQVLKQLQSMVSDTKCGELQKLYLEENESSERVIPSEYFAKAKPLFEGNEAFRLQFHSGVMRETPLSNSSKKARSAETDRPGKIWAPSPRVGQMEPCVWLVRPTLSIEYLGRLDEDINEEEEDDKDGDESASCEETPAASPQEEEDMEVEEPSRKKARQSEAEATMEVE